MRALTSDVEFLRSSSQTVESSRRAGSGSKLVCIVKTAALAHQIKLDCRPYFVVEAVSLRGSIDFKNRKDALEAASIILVEWDEQTARCLEVIAHTRWNDTVRAPIIALCDPKSTSGLQALLTGADYAVRPPVDASLLHVMMAAYRRRTHGRPDAPPFPDRTDTASAMGDGPSQDGDGQPDASCYVVGPLTLDERSRVACIDGDPIDLTERPFDLLCYLVRRVGECCTREQILRAVWGLEFNPSTNVVDVQIYALRNALRPYDMASAIQTVRGYGYRLQDLD
jgi:DNA-binding response OmpR family regulator